MRARKLIEDETAKQFLNRRIAPPFVARIVSEAENRLIQRIKRFQQAGFFQQEGQALKYSAVVAILATVVEDMQSENSLAIQKKIKRMREKVY